MALEANETHISEVRERATRTHRVFRWTGDKIGTPSLFPGDSKTVSLEYFVNNDLDDDGTIYTQYVTLTIGSADQPKVRIQKKFREISDF